MFKQKQIRQGVAASLILLASSVSYISGPTVQAAGVTLTVTPSTQNTATNGNVSITFTPVTAVTNGSTITFSIPSGYTGGASLLDADVTVTGTNITSTVESAFTATSFSSTITASANVTTPITIVIGGTNKLTSPVAAGNNPFALTTSVGDTGANFQYVGQANVVQVRGYVAPSLSFVIRDSTDTANTNTCDLGTITTSSVATCSYRLKVGANGTGYVISVNTSGNFTNGSTFFTNAAAGTAGTGGTAFAAGTENYGVVVTHSTPSNGTSTLASAYNAGATNRVAYNNTTAAPLLTVVGQNNPTTTAHSSLVTHAAAASSVTPSGAYTQTVTYTVAPTF